MHRKGLSSVLGLWTKAAIEDLDQTSQQILKAVNETQTMTLAICDLLRSPKEKELLRYIKAKGGAETLVKDESSIRELVEFSEKHGVLSENADEFARRKIDKQVASLREEFYEDWIELFERNKTYFDWKFDNQLSQIEVGLHSENDRVIGVVKGDAYLRVNHPVSYFPLVVDLCLSPSAVHRMCVRFGRITSVIYLGHSQTVAQETLRIRRNGRIASMLASSYLRYATTTRKSYIPKVARQYRSNLGGCPDSFFSCCRSPG